MREVVIEKFLRFIESGVSCCVIGCANRFKKGSGLNLFRFPDTNKENPLDKRNSQEELGAK